ncbi:MAG: tRNA preQ1(34) S-adenosylmethionine ribosyltransferase-isomerase QueA [Actinobacteria bacterium]|nr:tRNA preQ1(34) S-adenosylmethionine ribosyltransferase-isomerase QueA [Actinomycetota bacterium]
MRVSDFDYELPPERIATVGVEPRDAARLLVAIDEDPAAAPLDRTVADLDEFLRPGDVIVVNDTKVLPARVRFTRPTGGSSEVLLLAPLDDGTTEFGPGWWEGLARPSAKLKVGVRYRVDEHLSFEMGPDLGEGRRRIRPLVDGAIPHREQLLAALDAAGEMPLPPYLGDAHLENPDRYQTVYATSPGSAAAPTAGLHFTPELLERIEAAGAHIVRVELVVGLGTFRPMMTDDVEDHDMHHETYRVPPDTWAAVQHAKANGARVVAVGTTAVRALESAAARGELSGSTNLFIKAGFDWQVVDLLMTNFHMPRSTLLVMIDAFVGPRWRDLYMHGLDAGYRFLSFGDAMLLRRRTS